MSRGQDRRQDKRDTIAVLDSIRGHESTVAHGFNHTEGHCPKCGADQQMFLFCVPDNDDNLPALRGCSLEGEHLHRVCGRCRYPWIERPLDQAMLSESEGVVPAESELAAALALILDRTGGAELNYELVMAHRHWLLRFARDPEKRTLTVTASAPPEQVGRAKNASMEDIEAQEGA